MTEKNIAMKNVEQMYSYLKNNHPEAIIYAFSAWLDDHPVKDQIVVVAKLALYCRTVLYENDTPNDVYRDVVTKIANELGYD